MIESNSALLQLFDKSPLKQRKWREISALLPALSGMRCLDIGSDNGVISLLLRKLGGDWSSADLVPETVEAIRAVVGDNVEQIDGQRMPYSDSSFDLVIIVDFLEHIESDRQFIGELSRIMKPGSVLVVNVPNPRSGPLRWFRSLIGQTDAAHGHLRPGYSLSQLTELLAPHFIIEQQHAYSRFFSELADTLITAALDLLKRFSGAKKRGTKGTVVTGADMQRMGVSFKIYSMIYPLMSLMVRMDGCLFWMRGSMLIVKAKRL